MSIIWKVLLLQVLASVAMPHEILACKQIRSYAIDEELAEHLRKHDIKLESPNVRFVSHRM